MLEWKTIAADTDLSPNQTVRYWFNTAGATAKDVTRDQMEYWLGGVRNTTVFEPVSFTLPNNDGTFTVQGQIKAPDGPDYFPASRNAGLIQNQIQAVLSLKLGLLVKGDIEVATGVSVPDPAEPVRVTSEVVKLAAVAIFGWLAVQWFKGAKRA